MIHHGDLFTVLPTIEAESIDACVTDPPYGIGFMGREWDTFKPSAIDAGIRLHDRKTTKAPDQAHWRGVTSPSASASMVAGKNYDDTINGLRRFQEWTQQWSAEVFRVLKPGAYIVVCGAPRSYHRMACGLEDAGFVIRDKFAWLFGSGFPKNYNLGDGKGTALKPAHEPIALAWKPFKGTIKACHEKHGTAALNIDACRIGLVGDEQPSGSGTRTQSPVGRTDESTRASQGNGGNITDTGRWPANVVMDGWDERILYLRDNIPSEVRHLILEYFDDLGYLSSVSAPVRHLSESVEAGARQLVQPGLLRSVAQQESERRESPAQGQASRTRIDREDDADQDRARPVHKGADEPFMEGRALSDSRVLDGRCVDADAFGAREVCDDVPAIAYSRASAGDGQEVGAPVVGLGNCSSSERGQDGQPTPQPRDARQRDPQARALADHEGTSPLAIRERTTARGPFEVVESAIPQGWLKYFADTGKTVPSGAADAIDEQTGELVSGANPTRRGSDKFRDTYGAFKGQEECDAARGLDIGGASRFYYCAKPSREERDMGCYDLAPRQRDESRKEGNPGGDNPRNRGLQPRGNFHPTVKPVELMRWLVRLVTPIGGKVLDPFGGSGTTAMACVYEQRPFIIIEREAEYVEIIKRRVHAVAPLFTEAV